MANYSQSTEIGQQDRATSVSQPWSLARLETPAAGRSNFVGDRVHISAYLRTVAEITAATLGTGAAVSLEETEGEPEEEAEEVAETTGLLLPAAAAVSLEEAEEEAVELEELKALFVAMETAESVEELEEEAVEL